MKRIILLLALVSLAMSKPNIIQMEDANTILAKGGFKGIAERLKYMSETVGIEPSIAGGSRASLGQFPYQAAVLATSTEGLSICGGTLINREWVLTSSACIRGFDEVHVALGTIDLRTGVRTWESGNVASNHRHTHPSFNDVNFRNNIGLLYLQRAPADLLSRQNIGALDLPTVNDTSINFVGRNGTVSGFGMTTDMITDTYGFLSFVTLPIVENSVCSTQFPTYVTQNHICASTAGGRAPCIFDYGSPFTVELEGGRRVFAGFVSFTPNACTQFPATFERVDQHLEWIEARLNSSAMIGLNVSILIALFVAILKNF